MPRKSMSKVITTTTVRGVEVISGELVPQSYELDGKLGLPLAQGMIRKSHPNFVAQEVAHEGHKYQMSIDDFKQFATVVDEDEEN